MLPFGKILFNLYAGLTMISCLGDSTSDIEQGRTPTNIQVRLLSSSTMLIHWDEPETPNGHLLGYKVYYTPNFELPITQWESQVVGNNQLTTISELIPHTIYTIKVQAYTSVGYGPHSSPVHVKTQQSVPSQPSNLRASDIGEASVTLQWSKPMYSGERIESYELYWNDTYAKKKHHKRIPISESYTLTGLYPDTIYFVWLAARSQRGEGAPCPPIPLKTKQYVPGNPQDVKVIPINSTTTKVNWRPPQARDRNGIILWYHVHVQEIKEEGKSFINDSMKFYVVGDTLEINITTLQPDTMYAVQVAARTRNGDGDRSPPVNVRTPGGIPSRPDLILKFIEREPTIKIELEWSRPSQTYGELKGFLLRYGAKNHLLKEVSLKGSHVTTYRINDLERGVVYEFRVAGQNHIGVGQEAIKYMHTPDGPPTGPPTNISYHFQTSDVVCISWSPPIREQRNGQILKYVIQFQKKTDHNNIIIRNVTHSKAVFTNLEENTEYFFHVRAYTSQGVGPSSEKISLKREKDTGKAPMSVKAVATSDSSVEVWWEVVPTRGKVIGYKIFYTMAAVEDLDEWQEKSIGLTESADLVNLEKNAEYAIAVAARMKNSVGELSEKVTVKVKPQYVPLNLRAHEVTAHSMTLSWSPPIRLNPLKYKISFDAIKEFVDSQGTTQIQTIPKAEIKLNSDVRTHTVNKLSPFTTYKVNVSVIPTDNSYLPPTKITVTTQMAAPQLMVKPSFYAVDNGEEIQVILPQASEEYGPISHYYLVVVPENELTVQKNPDEFLTDALKNNADKIPQNSNLPYIAAKFPERNIPYIYNLGTGKKNNGFVNYALDHSKRYRIFVRSVVDTTQNHLYTSSPFSDFFSLDMRQVS